jgi:solute carrier family 8 (sodium/calcium exchanger)
LTIGYRTVADTAFAPKDYTHIDEHIIFGPKDYEKKIQIPIVDDDEWEPDLDFFVELYDPTKTPQSPQYHGEPIDGVATFTEGKVIEKSVDRLEGDDTITKVTILDEDFPGCLGFESTDITVKKADKKVDILIKRFDGSDGKISCMIRTESLVDQGSKNNAVEFEDYLPREERVTFQHQE